MGLRDCLGVVRLVSVWKILLVCRRASISVRSLKSGSDVRGASRSMVHVTSPIDLHFQISYFLSTHSLNSRIMTTSKGPKPPYQQSGLYNIWQPVLEGHPLQQLWTSFGVRVRRLPKSQVCVGCTERNHCQCNLGDWLDSLRGSSTSRSPKGSTVAECAKEYARGGNVIHLSLSSK